MTNSQAMYEDLRTRIQNRQLLPGTQLASENAFCLRYGISRPTVRRVLEKLCRLNLVEKRPGIGTFVRENYQETTKQKPDFRLGVDFLPGLEEYDSYHYYGRIMEGISRFKECSCLFRTLLTDDDRDINPEQIPSVDGLMLMNGYRISEQLSELSAYQIPMSVLCQPVSDPATAYFSVDNRLESELAITYLLNAGHRRILLITNELQEYSIIQREQGWRDAYCKAGLEVPEELVLSIKELRSNPEKIKRFLSEKHFSAIYFLSVAQMRLFLRSCEPFLIHSLDSYELICFDDLSKIPEFEHLICSYVQMPLVRMGADAMEYLFRKKSDPDYPVMRKFYPCKLVIQHK